MAVVIQVMENVSVSGLIFTENPSTMKSNEMVVETISGSLNLLVDNMESPDRIIIDKNTGFIKDYKNSGAKRFLSNKDIICIYENAIRLEKIFDTPIDIEWTGLCEYFTVLQVRPITSLKEDKNRDRKWYLTLTPKGQSLLDLTKRVEKELIPKLLREGEEFSKISPSSLSPSDFLKQLKLRGESYDYWLKVYWDDFIPLAHGIRNFGVFYNDLLTPDDPYEFVNLLKTQSLLAYERNNNMRTLAQILINLSVLKEKLQTIISEGYKGKEFFSLLEDLKKHSNSAECNFIKLFLEFLKLDMNVLYDNTALESAPEIILNVILTLSQKIEYQDNSVHKPLDSEDINDIYFKEAKKQNVFDQAEKWLIVGRVSWKLRDDDNILLGKLENQLLIFIEHGICLLKSKGKSVNVPPKLMLKDWTSIYDSLNLDSDLLIERESGSHDVSEIENVKSRQLMGQPSSSGVYTGIARVIATLQDFKKVKNGEVLVFDSVQPQMTFIISLAGAIIERRGGMLVHSSIIAREMNIPAVNGVIDATTLIKTGDTVTVNGDLGVVVIGNTNFGI